MLYKCDIERESFYWDTEVSTPDIPNTREKCFQLYRERLTKVDDPIYKGDNNGKEKWSIADTLENREGAKKGMDKQQADYQPGNYR